MTTTLELSVDGDRYTGSSGGEVVSVVDVAVTGTTMRVLSTRTDPRHRGQGYAEDVTRFALEDARSRGLTVVPICPYTVEFMATHEEYADLRA